MKRTTFAFAVAIVAAALPCAAPADTIVAAYDAGTSGTAPEPLTEGWSPGAPPADAANFVSEGVSPDGTTGFNAWRMLDNSTAGGQFLTWNREFTVEEQTTAWTNGWNLRARLRVADPVAGNAGSNSVVLLYGNNSVVPAGTARRFILFLDVNASGVLVASLAGGPTVTLTGVDPALHHVHEFDFDPATRTATYLVDGTSRATGYAGTGTNFNGVQWGTGSSGGRGDGYWNSVSFTIRAAPTPPVPVTNPQSATVSVGDSLTLTGSFSGVVTAWEWLKDGTPIPEATGPSLTIPFVRSTDAGRYVLRASNGAGSGETAEAVITVRPDAVPPAMTSIGVSIFGSRLRVTMSEPLDEAQALQAGNWSVAGRAVTGVTKVTDFLYDVAVDPAPAAGDVVTLTASGVKDQAGNPVTPASASATAASGFPVLPRLVAAFNEASAAPHPVDGVTWNDLSGNGNHARSRGSADTTPLRRPTVVPAGLNGRSTFGFLRANQQFLAIDGPVSLGLDGSDYTFFIVAKQATAPAAGAGYFPNLIRHQSDFNAANWGAYLFAGNTATGGQPALVVSARSASGGEVPCFVSPVGFGSWSLITGQVSGGTGTSTGRHEARDTRPATVATGSASGTLTFGTQARATFIGRSAGANVANESFDGEMAELLIYAGALTAEEQAAVQLYLRCRHFGADEADLVVLQRPDGDIEVTFAGVLQRSADLQSWTTHAGGSPLLLRAGARLPAEYFRSVCP